MIKLIFWWIYKLHYYFAHKNRNQFGGESGWLTHRTEWLVFASDQPKMHLFVDNRACCRHFHWIHRATSAANQTRRTWTQTDWQWHGEIKTAQGKRGRADKNLSATEAHQMWICELIGDWLIRSEILQFAIFPLALLDCFICWLLHNNFNILLISNCLSILLHSIDFDKINPHAFINKRIYSKLRSKYILITFHCKEISF